MVMPPQNPNRNFDFILQDSHQKSNRLLRLPRLPKKVKLILASVIGLFIILIVISILSSHKSSANQPFINVLSRQQEIMRVTQLTQQQLQLQDPATQALAATTYSSVSSEQQQLIGYLASNGIKVSTKSLTGDQNKNTDLQLESAAQNNNLDAAYTSYLKQALGVYQTDLQTAAKTAGPNGKKLLNEAFDSTKTLLDSPPLKS